MNGTSKLWAEVSTDSKSVSSLVSTISFSLHSLSRSNQSNFEKVAMICLGKVVITVESHFNFARKRLLLHLCLSFNRSRAHVGHFFLIYMYTCCVVELSDRYQWSSNSIVAMRWHEIKFWISKQSRSFDTFFSTNATIRLSVCSAHFLPNNHENDK